jgi:hypothetical protein
MVVYIRIIIIIVTIAVNYIQIKRLVIIGFIAYLIQDYIRYERVQNFVIFHHVVVQTFFVVFQTGDDFIIAIAF